MSVHPKRSHKRFVFICHADRSGDHTDKAGNVTDYAEAKIEAASTYSQIKRALELI